MSGTAAAVAASNHPSHVAQKRYTEVLHWIEGEEEEN